MLECLLSKEELAVQNEAREFVRSVPADLLRQMDKDEVRYPKEYVVWLAEKKLLGLRFEKKWGGRALNWAHEVAALEEIGVLGMSLTCLYSLPSIVGEALQTFGNEAQKEKYLRPMLAGKKFCAEALTEPRGGSDFFGATTRAKKVGDKYILNGQKRFIVGGEGADFFFVYARTGDENTPPRKALSAFIVERDFGVKVEYLYGLMGSRGGATARISFNECEVPCENIIAEEGDGGEIFNRMMIPERLTSAAGALGIGRAALEIAARYSDKRKAFGKKIRRFEGVSFKVAESAALLDAAEALVYAAAKSIDGGRDSRRIVSEAKKIATETSWQVTNNAMQIMGGIGYTDIFPIERYLRDLRLAMIWTGTNEIMNLLIQHEYYKELSGDTEMKRDCERDALNYADSEEIVFE